MAKPRDRRNTRKVEEPNFVEIAAMDFAPYPQKIMEGWTNEDSARLRVGIAILCRTKDELVVGFDAQGVEALSAALELVDDLNTKLEAAAKLMRCAQARLLGVGAVIATREAV